jgi:Fur family ferric uptake transcriptional regulator
MSSQSHSNRGGGRRSTQQREAIRAVFRLDGRPLGVSEVLARARQAVPSLNQATVYRNLNMLVTDGWLVEVAPPEAGTLYERAGKDHHHHFYCRRCSRVFELPGCPLPAVHGPEGCRTEGHELFLHGLCRECVAATDSTDVTRGG